VDALSITLSMILIRKGVVGHSICWGTRFVQNSVFDRMASHQAVAHWCGTNMNIFGYFWTLQFIQALSICHIHDIPSTTLTLQTYLCSSMSNLWAFLALCVSLFLWTFPPLLLTLCIFHFITSLFCLWTSSTL